GNVTSENTCNNSNGKLGEPSASVGLPNSNGPTNNSSSAPPGGPPLNGNELTGQLPNCTDEALIANAIGGATGGLASNYAAAAAKAAASAVVTERQLAEVAAHARDLETTLATMQKELCRGQEQVCPSLHV
ncbi:unnamed protein product, partial [Protopolystoma xenopodis]